MSHSKPFLKKITTINEVISSQVAQSYKKERLAACHHFLETIPNVPSFFWIGNTKDLSLEEMGYVKEMLGFDHLNQSQVLELIPKEHIDLYQRIWLAINQLFLSGKFGQSILNFTFTINIPLRDINNQYWYVQQSNSPCEVNAQNQVLNFLSLHTILHPFHGEPITIKGYSNQGQRLYETEEAIKKEADYHKMLPFTETERKVLTIFLNLEKPSLKLVAEEMNLSLNTIYTHTKKMKISARLKYGRAFKDIFQLAQFFKNHNYFDDSK